MNFLSLFAGIGGFDLGLERAGLKCVAQCEIDEYCIGKLNKHWPDVPVFKDIRKLKGEQFKGSVELICGGFPCQPFSVAGKQEGFEDDRHLWPEMFRLIKEIKPKYVIGENVAGFIAMALDDVLSDLESESYRCEVFVLPACSVGGIHRRYRVWIVAHLPIKGLSIRRQSRKQEGDKKGKTRLVDGVKRYGNSRITTHSKLTTSRGGGNPQECHGQERQHPKTRPKSVQPENRESHPSNSKSISSALADSSTPGVKTGISESRQGKERFSKITNNNSNRQRERGFKPIELPTEHPVRHRDDGLPDNVARLRALGNAVVPQIPELIGRAIMEIENEAKQNR